MVKGYLNTFAIKEKISSELSGVAIYEVFLVETQEHETVGWQMAIWKGV